MEGARRIASSRAARRMGQGSQGRCPNRRASSASNSAASCAISGVCPASISRSVSLGRGERSPCGAPMNASEATRPGYSPASRAPPRAAHGAAGHVRALHADGVHEGAQPLHLLGVAVALVLVPLAGAEAGQVGHDHAVVRGQPARQVHPMVLLGEDAVQQQHGLAAPALQIMQAVPRHPDLARRKARQPAVQIHQRRLEHMRQPALRGVDDAGLRGQVQRPVVGGADRQLVLLWCGWMKPPRYGRLARLSWRFGLC